jgi:hypothetical protein
MGRERKIKEKVFHRKGEIKETLVGASISAENQSQEAR